MRHGSKIHSAETEHRRAAVRRGLPPGSGVRRSVPAHLAQNRGSFAGGETAGGRHLSDRCRRDEDLERPQLGEARPESNDAGAMGKAWVHEVTGRRHHHSALPVRHRHRRHRVHGGRRHRLLRVHAVHVGEGIQTGHRRKIRLGATLARGKFTGRNDMWQLMTWVAWAVSAVLLLWMFWDFVSVNRRYSEDVLLSSREGVDDLFGETSKTKGN